MEALSLGISGLSTCITNAYLPHDIKHHIVRELYNDAEDLEDTADLVSLSISSKSWRLVSLPFLYWHCGIGGRGNFAIENWQTRILPRYGQFIRSIDIALCWTHSNYLPERERESMELDQSGITNPWENARDELVARLISRLPNTSTVKITMLQCTAGYKSSECSCANRFGRTIQTFEHRRFQSMVFHGVATTFCPRLAQLIFVSSANSIQTIAFSDDIDGYPSSSQPFDHICQLPVLSRMTFAAASFRMHDVESLSWVCPLKTITITNETIDRIVQPLSIAQVNTLLQKFTSSLSSLAFHDVSIERQVPESNQLLDLPSLAHFTLHSTQESTFRVLELLEAHAFELLSIVIIPKVKPYLLLSALSKGAFPALKQIEICFNPQGHWSSSSRWDSKIRATVQAVCDERRITLKMVEDNRHKVSRCLSGSINVTVQEHIHI